MEIAYKNIRHSEKGIGLRKRSLLACISTTTEARAKPTPPPVTGWKQQRICGNEDKDSVQLPTGPWQTSDQRRVGFGQEIITQNTAIGLGPIKLVQNT